MSYQVLARKWRPRRFQEMVGQETTLRMLENALDQQRLHHAYLFTGTRGVGKTTLARILAKCLNCETGVTSKPCGSCHNCSAIDAGQFLDLFEIDAASRTKVEDTRDLLDNVLYPPTQGRYKVYLIDEVHMLSNHSFNALLKTLEEPPEYVKFLLATTDPKRLPITILSRCLQFHLKRIPIERITAHLQHVCDQEKMAYEPPAFAQLAKAADGSMRDALSLLDQAIAYGHGKVTSQEVHAMLGSIAQEDLHPLLSALANQDGPALFEHIASLSERAPDFKLLLDEFINLLHTIAVHQIVPGVKPTEANIHTFSQQIKPEDIQLYYQIALLGRRDLAIAPSANLGFEMTFLRMLAFQPQSDTFQPQPSTIQPAKTVTATPNTVEPTPAPTPMPPPSTISANNDWRDILPKLELNGMAYALAANCILENIKDSHVTLTLSHQHQPMLNAKLKDRINEALSRHLKQNTQLTINITTAELLTPVKQQQAEQTEKLTQAKTSILKDDLVKQFVDLYDATVEVTLI